jgi:hypothetical protein
MINYYNGSAKRGVVMKMVKPELDEDMQLEAEIYAKLLEADQEAATTTLRYTHEEVFEEARAIIARSLLKEKNV